MKPCRCLARADRVGPWSRAGGVGLRTTSSHTGGVAWAGVIGYRALYVDDIRGSGVTLFETNWQQHGPVIGVSARF